MPDYKHSVSLDVEKCKGCTICLKRLVRYSISIAHLHSARISIRVPIATTQISADDNLNRNLSK